MFRVPPIAPNSATALPAHPLNGPGSDWAARNINQGRVGQVWATRVEISGVEISTRVGLGREGHLQHGVRGLEVFRAEDRSCTNRE
jgi:hypothetical protein